MFNIGDRVIVTRDYDNELINNSEGIILAHNPLETEGRHYLIQFDEDIGGHEGNWDNIIGKDYCCWWCFPNDIVVLKSMQRITFGEYLKEKYQAKLI